MSGDALAAYKFHGIDFTSEAGKEAIGTCPFCDKEQHFFVNKNTGQFSCKKCGREGNSYTFLTSYHKQLLAATKKDDWLALSESRRIPWQTLKEFDAAYDRLGDRWLLPVRNGSKSLVNLLTFPWKTDKPKLLGTAGCAQHLFGGHDIKLAGPIYICEGQWDAIALSWLLEKNGLDPGSYTVLAVPGASTWKKEWCELVKTRHVILLYDNDTEGSSGMDKVQKLLTPWAASIRRIVWPADFPEKYDIRDFITERIDVPRRAWKQLQALIPDKEHHNRTITRRTFKSIIKDFRRVIHMGKSVEDALAIILAVTFSARVEGDPLWLFLVGPPGAGKTLLIQVFLDSPNYAEFISKLSKSALVSGWRDEEDVSVLPRLQGKCLFVKDYTAIKSMPLGAQEELYGLLRDAYDGAVSIPYGNGVTRDYHDLYFSVVAGVTDIIHGDNRASLGERFLKMELLDEHHNPDEHIRAALNDVCETARDDQLLRDSIASFLDRPFDPADLPSVPSWFINRIVSLAQLAANLRATVERKGSELLYRPRPEIGSRLAKQLTKLARFVAYVLGKSKIDREVYRLVQKVALDTVVGFNLEILHALYQSHKGLTVSDLGGIMQLSHTTIANRLNDLQELRIVQRSIDTRKDARGRPQFVWYMTDNIRGYWKAAEITYTPPKLFFADRKGYRPKGRKKKTYIRKRKLVTV